MSIVFIHFLLINIKKFFAKYIYRLDTSREKWYNLHKRILLVRIVPGHVRGYESYLMKGSIKV